MEKTEAVRIKRWYKATWQINQRDGVRTFVSSIWARFRRTRVVKTLRGVSSPPLATWATKMTAADAILPTKNSASFLDRYQLTSLICFVSFVLTAAILFSKLFSQLCIFITLTPAAACEVKVTRASVMLPIFPLRKENFLARDSCIDMNTKTSKPKPVAKVHPIPIQPRNKIAIVKSGAQMIKDP